MPAPGALRSGPADLYALIFSHLDVVVPLLISQFLSLSFLMFIVFAELPTSVLALSLQCALRQSAPIALCVGENTELTRGMVLFILCSGIHWMNPPQISRGYCGITRKVIQNI